MDTSKLKKRPCTAFTMYLVFALMLRPAIAQDKVDDSYIQAALRFKSLWNTCVSSPDRAESRKRLTAFRTAAAELRRSATNQPQISAETWALLENIDLDHAGTQGVVPDTPASPVGPKAAGRGALECLALVTINDEPEDLANVNRRTLLMATRVARALQYGFASQQAGELRSRMLPNGLVERWPGETRPLAFPHPVILEKLRVELQGLGDRYSETQVIRWELGSIEQFLILSDRAAPLWWRLSQFDEGRSAELDRFFWLASAVVSKGEKQTQLTWPDATTMQPEIKPDEAKLQQIVDLYLGEEVVGDLHWNAVLPAEAYLYLRRVGKKWHLFSKPAQDKCEAAWTEVQKRAQSYQYRKHSMFLSGVEVTGTMSLVEYADRLETSRRQ